MNKDSMIYAVAGMVFGFVLGYMAANMGDLAEPRPAPPPAEFDRALARDPGHKKAPFNKGIALMQTGKPKEAVAVWEGLLKRYPDDPQLRGLREQIDQVRATGGRS
jgi:hypothetical protein